MPLHHIIYMSTCVKPFTDGELNGLLLAARTANERHEITGMLVYSRGNVFQIIEGKRTDLNALYNKLLVDPRHSGLVKLADKCIQRRSFTDWSMAYTLMDCDAFSVDRFNRSTSNLVDLIGINPFNN